MKVAIKTVLRCLLSPDKKRQSTCWYRWRRINLSEELAFVQFNIYDCDNGKYCITAVD